jgi:MFS-type transporter involved in bile tolerance (Atg22 family)
MQPWTIIAQIAFFALYFVAWLDKELPHVTWVSASAILALLVAIFLFVELVIIGYPRIHRSPPNS